MRIKYTVHKSERKFTASTDVQCAPTLLNLLKKALEQLPKSGIKIYKIKYRNGVLSIEGEATPKAINLFNPSSMKNLPNGNFLFEIKVSSS